uniref:Alkyl transferase n=1 Tax=Syphacia muris TaxID=451379 RepID=A0A0N5AHE2_9BILA
MACETKRKEKRTMDGDQYGWLNEKPLDWWQWMLKGLLQLRPMPKHIAIIMDGNRRYARASHMETTCGHIRGFNQLTKVLTWCRALNITEVSVYAFSIENFKRSPTEVNELMGLLEAKLYTLLSEMEKIAKEQVSFRFCGDLSFFPKKIQSLIARIELQTMNFTRYKVNVCVAYTSQNEMQRAFSAISAGVRKGLLDVDDIDEELITRCLDTANCSDPDMLIRTSGEKRFSDFLLWQAKIIPKNFIFYTMHTIQTLGCEACLFIFQCSTCYIHFDDVLWPEFGFWNLFKALLGYQSSLSQIMVSITVYLKPILPQDSVSIFTFVLD